jgi:benzylsuccinate CoA-transferase BbsF subunit
VYPTRDDERFIALSIFDAADWARFTACLTGSWPDAQQLSAADEAGLDALDQQLSAATRRWDDYELMQALQAAGVAAGVVQDAQDLLERDPQLRARGAFVSLEHPVLGRFDHQSCPYQLSRTPAAPCAAPLLGQHTERICRELLNMSAEEFERLQAQKLFW